MEWRREWLWIGCIWCCLTLSVSLSVEGVRWSEVVPNSLIGKCQIPKKRAVPLPVSSYSAAAAAVLPAAAAALLCVGCSK